MVHFKIIIIKNNFEKEGWEEKYVMSNQHSWYGFYFLVMLIPQLLTQLYHNLFTYLVLSSKVVEPHRPITLTLPLTACHVGKLWS